MKAGDRVRVTFEGVVTAPTNGFGRVRVRRDDRSMASYIYADTCEVIVPAVNIGDELDHDGATKLPTGSIVAWRACAYVVRNGRLFESVDGVLVPRDATATFRVLHIAGRSS